MTEAIRQGDIPGVQLRRRRLLPGVAASTVWAWLTEPDRLTGWLAASAVADPTPGGRLELVGGGDESGWREVGETVAAEPPRRWVLDFRREDWEAATRLELDITESAEGAELSVLQRGFENLPLSIGLTVWEAYRRRWTAALERLAQAVITS